MDDITQTKLLIVRNQNLRSAQLNHSGPKIKAFGQEFPFILDHINYSEVKSVHVSAVHSELFGQVVDCIETCDPFGGGARQYSEEVFLLDHKGKLVSRSTGKKVWLFWNETLSGKIPCGSRVDTYLMMFGSDVERIRFILSFQPYTQALILYKVKSGSTIGEWIQGQTEWERARIQGTLASI